eukprot:Opistho-2@24962
MEDTPGSPGRLKAADPGRQARLDRIRQSMDEFRRTTNEMSTPGLASTPTPVAARDGLLRANTIGHAASSGATPQRKTLDMAGMRMPGDVVGSSASYTISPAGTSSSAKQSAPSTPVKGSAQSSTASTPSVASMGAAPPYSMTPSASAPRISSPSKEKEGDKSKTKEKEKEKEREKSKKRGDAGKDKHGKGEDASAVRDPTLPQAPPDFGRVLSITGSLSGDFSTSPAESESSAGPSGAGVTRFVKTATVIRHHDKPKDKHPSAKLAVTMPTAPSGATSAPSAAAANTADSTSLPASPSKDINTPEGSPPDVPATVIPGIVGVPVNPVGAGDPLTPASIEKSAVAKFYLEQHFENVLKACTERIRRKEQLEAEMARMDLTVQQKDQLRAILRQKESEYIRLKRVKMDKSMFQAVKTIGVGAFGEFVLVRKADTQHLYAMKVLRKADVLRRNQIAHVKAERDILAEADNEWVVKLFYSFQDSEKLYFVMEYVPGGDMMTMLIRMGTFPEAMCRFYIAELTLAIDSVHKMGFSHRDIKPDNILIDKDGHIKLTDFGLSTGFRWTHDSQVYQELTQQQQQQQESLREELQRAQQNGTDPKEIRRLQRTMAHSLVGTPNYIAPEVLQGTGYNKACDWWSMGIIMFEMLFGHPPFFSQTPSETKRKVLNWKQHLRMPTDAGVSPAARDMVLNLCCGPEDRIGSKGAEEIKRHPFFAQINWAVNHRKQEAPYIPAIRYDGDTSNFDDIPSQPQGTGGAPNSAGHGPHAKHAFIEFTFRRFWNLTRRPSSSYSVERRKDNRKSAFF